MVKALSTPPAQDQGPNAGEFDLETFVGAPGEDGLVKSRPRAVAVELS